MVSKPKNCHSCTHSRLIKGAQCYCTLRQAVVSADEVIDVADCELAQAAYQKSQQLVAEARAARQARGQADVRYDEQPVAATG